MKMAVEEAVSAALGKIPGLKDLLSTHEIQVPQRPPIQIPLNADAPGTSSNSKYTGNAGSYSGPGWGNV